ncbi:N-acetyltransferase, partial [Pseudidiomarina aestuarii]
SEFGEQLTLPVSGEGEAVCEHTGTRYILNGNQLTKLVAGS